VDEHSARDSNPSRSWSDTAGRFCSNTIDPTVEDSGAGGAQSLANQSATNNPTGEARIR
jgi:hypothetical protein